MHPIQTMKKVAKAVVKFIMALPFLIKLFVIIALVAIVMVVVDWVINVLMAEETPKAIYSAFDVEDMRELVEIKKSEDDSGYYLDFTEDFDEKIDDIMQTANYGKSVHTLPKDKEFLKKLIKAEVITQFPNLGGNIPQNSNGFQGVVDIRRVTPNKEIGSIEENPGRGETSNIEPEITYDIVEDNLLHEEKVKSWKEGQALYITSKALVYAQRESEINPEENTGFWYVVKKEETPDEDLTISEGTKVTYTGTYKKNINPLNSSLSEIYVEVKTERITGFVSASVLETELEEVIVGKKEVTTRANEEERIQQETIGKEGKKYTIAIGAGHNNTDNKGARKGKLIEEQLTIKTAEKVQELLEKYTNISVVQVGSTSSNPGGVKVKERTQKAKEAKPDLCIQIHYNAGGGSGVEAIYKNGDGISQQLAEFLSESMANSMGLENRSAGPDVEKSGKSLGIIENAASSGFPSVVTEGGFIDGEPDAELLKKDGTDKCAQGIVEGIKKYLEADHTGYTAINVTEQKTQESVNSRVCNLKYIKRKEFKDLLKKANEGEKKAQNEILEVYTLDQENKIVTATWESENGKITYKQNSSMDIETSLKKYVMPYEYLLYFYMDTNETEFSEKLAEEIFNTEIVISIQDNINTTKIVETTIQWTEATDPAYARGEEVVNTTITTTEVCNPKIEVTYADTWCVKFYKENSYSKTALDWGEEDKKKVLNIKGKANQTSNESETPSQIIASGTYTITHQPEVEGGEPTYTYINWVTYQKIKTTTDNMTINYDTGEATVKGNVNKFVKLYQNCKMYNWVRPYYLLEMIEKNEKTANLLDLTKYLMYQATNNFYGQVGFDFNTFVPKNMTSLESEIYGGNVEEKVWYTLKSLGFSEYAVAGVMGNIFAESGFNPAAVEGGYTENNGGIGLCQWTNFPRASSNGRNTQLKAYATSKGKEWTDEDIQIEFLVAELTRTGDALAYTSDQLVGDHRTKWENATSIEEATIHFCLGFERCSEEAYQQSKMKRINAAQGYYSEYNGKTWTGEGSASAVVEQARGALGVPYVWGGESYTTGMDCSGLVKVCYQRALGVVLPHKASALMTDSHFTTVSSISELSGGDIIVSTTHVGIYTGENTVIHEPRTGDVCKEVSLDSFIKSHPGAIFRRYNQ